MSRRALTDRQRAIAAPWFRARKAVGRAPVPTTGWSSALTLGGRGAHRRGATEGLKGVGYVIMDAACDADDLGALARIKRNPTCREDRPIDWMLYTERHAAGRFFSRIKYCRRIALRCEKTVNSFEAVADLARAMAWIGQMQTPARAPEPHARSSALPVRHIPRGLSCRRNCSTCRTS